MFAEAIIGAGLVLLALVEQDASMLRAVSTCLHLGNTFLLLAATALTAWWASGGAPLRVRGQGAVAYAIGLPVAAMFFVGASGAVTALGDTLFPAISLAAGIAQDTAPGAHAFVRLRALHPVLAVTTAAGIAIGCGIARALRPTASVKALSRLASGLAGLQVCAGLLDLLTLAPVALQLVHLVLADAVWLALVLTGAAAMRREVEPVADAGAVRSADA
jgi:hypothetical protein